MAIATSTAILGAAAVGGAASIYGASQQSRAADRAGDTQAQANADAIQFQREGRDIAERELRPYVQNGRAANSRLMAHLGLGGTSQPSAAPSYSGGLARSGGIDGRAYLAAHPDVADAYMDPQFSHMSEDEFAQLHYNLHGRREGRVTGSESPQGDVNPQTAEEAQDQAWQDYLRTPFAAIGRYEADKASEEFLDRAGSTGTALSGRTARGMAEVSEEAALRNFYGYTGALGGVADTGFNASSGIASAGQNYADSSANLAAATGAAQAQAQRDSANAWSTGLADAAGWAGWAAGNSGIFNKTPTTTTTTNHSTPMAGPINHASNWVN